MSESEPVDDGGTRTGAGVDDDAWAVFGSDSDSNSDDDDDHDPPSRRVGDDHGGHNRGHCHNRYYGSGSAEESMLNSAAAEGAADASSLHLTTSFLRQCPSVRLSDRYVTVHSRVGVRRPRGISGTNVNDGDQDDPPSSLSSRCSRDDGAGGTPQLPPSLLRQCQSALADGLRCRGMRVIEWPPASDDNIQVVDVGGGPAGSGRRGSIPTPPPTSDAVAIFDVAMDENENKNGECSGEGRGEEEHAALLLRSVVPGGWLLLFSVRKRCGGSAFDEASVGPSLGLNPRIWAVEDAVNLLLPRNRSDHAGPCLSVWAVKKREGLINTRACPWKDDNGGGFGCNSACTEEPSWKSDPRTYELRLVSETTVGRTAHERSFPPYHPDSLCEDSVTRAVGSLRKHGFVVLRDLVPSKDVMEWGDAALRDLDEAVRRLDVDRGIKLLEPGRSADPVSYRELAMREDLRVDIRDGPAMRALMKRQGETRRQIMRSSSKEERGTDESRGGEVDEGSQLVENSSSLLRRLPSVLAVVSRAMNPPGPHHRGNYGRWNFGGSGPDGSPRPVKVGRIGAVVSMPGCGDQALHADTPHLFEHTDLPPHYVNLFYPALEQLPPSPSLRGGEGGGDGAGGGGGEDEEDVGCWEFDGDTDVGGTAFVAGSHVLDVCERLTAGEEEDGDEGRRRGERLARIVRPSLDAGDALLFDCRVLHFGLANRSSGSSSKSSKSSSKSSASRWMERGGVDGIGDSSRGHRRPLLYVNLTHEWFNDPKNWDDREKLFPELD